MSSGYVVELTSGARKTLRKMDAHDRKIVLAWLYSKLEGCENPRHFGKGLTGDRAGEWRYRIGDYRIIVEIQDEKVVVMVFAIGHRRDVYKAK